MQMSKREIEKAIGVVHQFWKFAVCVTTLKLAFKVIECVEAAILRI